MTNTAKQQAEVIRKLRAWLIESGLTPTSIPGPEEGVHHHITFNFPAGGPTTFHLIRPKDRSLTVLVVGTKVSPQHMQTLQQSPPKLQQDVIKALRRIGFQGGIVGIAPSLQGDVLTGWQLDLEVYDDGLSQQSLFGGVRALLSKHFELIDAFNDALGANLNGGAVGATGTASYIR